MSKRDKSPCKLWMAKNATLRGRDRLEIKKPRAAFRRCIFIRAFGFYSSLKPFSWDLAHYLNPPNVIILSRGEKGEPPLKSVCARQVKSKKDRRQGEDYRFLTRIAVCTRATRTCLIISKYSRKSKEQIKKKYKNAILNSWPMKETRDIVAEDWSKLNQNFNISQAIKLRFIITGKLLIELKNRRVRKFLITINISWWAIKECRRMKKMSKIAILSEGCELGLKILEWRMTRAARVWYRRVKGSASVVGKTLLGPAKRPATAVSPRFSGAWSRQLLSADSPAAAPAPARPLARRCILTCVPQVTRGERVTRVTTESARSESV